jgi:hypothetical protein
MWLRTTNELGMSGADDEHKDQEGINMRSEAIKEDEKG